MAGFAAGVILGAVTVLAVALGMALVVEVDAWEGSWEDPCYHTGPRVDPAEAHAEDGPP